MNKQEIFSLIVKKQLEQADFSKNKGELNCVSCYLDKDGNRCMIGHLAEDDGQAERWQYQSKTFDDLLEPVFVSFPELRKYNEFFVKVQRFHDIHAGYMDYGWDEDMFMIAINNFAGQNGLEMVQ